MTDAPRSGALCNLCQLLFTHESCNVLDEEQNVIHDYVRGDTLPHLPTLEKEASAGCPFCAELKKRIIERSWPDGTRDLTIGPATLVHESLWESDLTPEQDGVWMVDVIILSLENANSVTLHFDLFSALHSSAHDRLRMRRRRPFNDRRSPECIEQLSQWIFNCGTFHWQCFSGDANFWPTRVVDVGPADGSIDPKLIVTSGEASKYVALSHCWGKPGPGIRSMRTISSTMGAYMAGIPLNTMPLNYQHAVFMTRDLGFRYLWIDSLCIQQDSAADWATQGAQMDKIYKHAWVTLAATSASDSEGGFLEYSLEDRMISIQVPAELVGSTRSEDETGCQIFARYMERADSSRLEPDVDGSKWNSRGWTLQERHLSRRTIHFSASQIFWECRRGIESECGQRIIQLPCSMTRAYGPNDSTSEYSDDSDAISTDGMETLDAQFSQASFSDNTQAPLANTNVIAEKIRLYTWWFRIVGDYSRRALTYSSDKLPAISGLAKELETALADRAGSKEQYLAGIWTGALTDCLLWTPDNPNAMTRSEVYRAPSWSWALWNGATMPTARDLPNLQPESDMVEYVAHNIILENEENPYGEIKEASLRIRGGLVPVRLAEIDERYETVWRYDLYSADGPKIGLVCLDAPAALLGPLDSGIHVMQIKVQIKCDYDQPARLLGYSGLVLRFTGVKETFERIGVFILDEEHLYLLTKAEKSVVTLV